MVKVVLITPEAYYGSMMDIVKERRGTDIVTQFLDDGQVTHTLTEMYTQTLTHTDILGFSLLI